MKLTLYNAKPRLTASFLSDNAHTFSTVPEVPYCHAVLPTHTSDHKEPGQTQERQPTAIEQEDN